MKNRFSLHIVEFLLLLVFMLGSVMILPPFTRLVDERIEQGIQSTMQRLEDSTGLSITYASLSPSILRTINLKDVVIHDELTSTILARFSTLSVSYSIPELLQGRVVQSLRSVGIHNGEITIDRQRNASVLSRLFPANRTETRSPVLFDQGLEVTLSSIKMSFKDADREVSLNILSGNAVSENDVYNFEFRSSAKYLDSRSTLFSGLSANIGLKGSLNHALTTGSSSMKLESLKGDNFLIQRIGLVASWNNNIVSVRSVQDLQAVDIGLMYEPESGNLDFSLVCERLMPIRWLGLTVSHPLYRQMQDADLSGTIRVNRKGLSSYTYSLEVDSNIPASFQGGGRLDMSLSGNNTQLNINSIAFTGTRHDFSLSGFIDLQTMLPELVLSIDRLTVSKEHVLSARITIDHVNGALMIRSPEIRAGTGSLLQTVIMLTPVEGSWDVFLSAVDTKGGRYGIDGTLSLGPDRFLDVYASFDSIHLENIFALAGLSVPGISEIMVTTEAYVSTNFTSYSFNCTRLVAASADTDDFILLLSADGNENNLAVSDISLTVGKQTLAGRIEIILDEGQDFLFDATFRINDLPYTFSGIYSTGSFSLYGDYGLAVSASMISDGSVTGTVHVGGMPLPLSPVILSVSLDSAFRYRSSADWKLSFSRLDIEEVTSLLPSSPTLSASGSVEPGGIFCESLLLSDQFSSLAGNVAINYFFDEQTGNEISMELSLEAADLEERISVVGQMTASNDLFFEASLMLDEFYTGHVLAGQSSKHRISANLSLSGTPENLFSAGVLSRFSGFFKGFDLDCHASYMLEDNTLFIRDAGLSWNTHRFSTLEAEASLTTLSARISAFYEGIVGSSSLSSDITLDLTGERSEIPTGESSLLDSMSRYTARVQFRSLSWKQLVMKEDLVVSVIREPGITALFAGPDDMINGFILDDGTFGLSASDNSPVLFTANGMLSSPGISVQVDDFSADLARVWNAIGLSFVSFDGGVLKGSFTISGLMNDPDFNGTLVGDSLLVRSPFVDDLSYGPISLEIQAQNKELSIPVFTLSSKKGTFYASSLMRFDRWFPSDIEVNAYTATNQDIPLSLKLPFFSIYGRSSFNLLLTYRNGSLRLGGTAGISHGHMTMFLSGFAPSSENRRTFPFLLDMNIHVGQRFEFRWPSEELPILNGLIYARDPLVVSLDTQRGLFSFKGIASLRGGEIFYLNRSFYLRQGQIVFNENQNIFDPVISFRAEIRERDSDGELVRIRLSSEEQRFSQFMPVLSSDPAKGETELLVLLGQVATADFSRDTLFRDTVITATDLLTQFSLYRNIENTIRDTLRLDLFSVRTLLLQNVLFYTYQNSDNQLPMTFGNYFDNTTVYMGKYFGSAIYADALLHFSYYDPKTTTIELNRPEVYGNMLFQPEIGLEMTTPFFLFRWGFSPENPQNLFVPDNSLTFSWKFSY